MRKTLREQIATNTRWSLFYCFLVLLLLAGMVAVITEVYAPTYWWLGALAATVVGLVLILVAWNVGPKIVLNISQARDATPLELQRLQNVTEEMALAAGIPTPHVYLIDDETPNAFATGSDPKRGVVVVTTGLMKRLNREELQGVVAHEIGHIRNNDIKLMTTLALVVGLFPLIRDVFWNMLRFGAVEGSRRRDAAGAQVVILAVAIVFVILAPVFAVMLQLAVSRQREFLADTTAAELSRNPEGLASALEKIARHQGTLEAANQATAHLYIINPLRKANLEADSVFSTHPPLHARIRALRSLAGHRPRPAQDFSDMPRIPDQRD